MYNLRGTAYIDAGRERVRDNSNYDMTMSELKILSERAVHEDLSTAIGDAYYMGIEAGARMIEESIAN